MHITNNHLIPIKCYMKHLRYLQYVREKSGLFNRFRIIFHERRRNTLGNKLGFFMGYNVLGKGTTIYHHGTIIINESARLGENCKLHGNNCIGNDGFTKKAPVIGNNVDIGFGASIIGDVHIADDCKIGAGAVVVKSCDIKGATLVGVPARVINP